MMQVRPEKAADEEEVEYEGFKKITTATVNEDNINDDDDDEFSSRLNTFIVFF